MRSDSVKVSYSNQTTKEAIMNDSKPNTFTEFEVKHFAIQLNKESHGTWPLAKFKVNNVLTFIETRFDYLKANGQLGSLAIFDISPQRGLYTERFATSGKQALDFEFFKNSGKFFF